MQLAGSAPVRDATHLDLHLVVDPRPGYPFGPDLDNLCERIFSVLVNRIGWFGARRPNIQGWRATKAVGTLTGVRVRVLDAPRVVDAAGGRTLLDLPVSGPLPLHARDEPFAERVRRAMIDLTAPASTLLVELMFTGPINLGDVATGRVKSVIDCLWPVLGGAPGAPDDDRISCLEVIRVHDDTAPSVHVRVSESM